MPIYFLDNYGGTLQGMAGTVDNGWYSSTVPVMAGTVDNVETVQNSGWC